MFGWVIGFWLAVVFAKILRDPIFEHVKGIVSCTDESSTKLKNLRNVAILTLIMSICSLTIYLSFILPQGTERQQKLAEYDKNFQLLVLEAPNCNERVQDNDSTWFYGADFI